MPGKYLEYIKAGRFVVPVEITFLQAPFTDELTRKEEFSSKWANRDDWKEIKNLLKPAVESCLKYNDYLPEKVPKSTQLDFGQEVGLGYAIAVNKDKCPFFAVLDAKRNCWTDDEDEEVDEDSGFKSFGGSFKPFTPTKFYLKVVVLRKTFSTSTDSKRIQQYMGTKTDDIRQYYKPTNSSPSTSINPSTELNASSSDKNDTKHAFRKTLIQQVEGGNGTRNRTENILDLNEVFDSEPDLIITKEKLPSRRSKSRKWPIASVKPNIASLSVDSFWERNTIEGSYYEEKDEDGDELDLDQDDDDGLFSDNDTDGPTPYFLNSIMAIEEDDDDSFSLPDIIDSPATLRESEKIEKKYSDDEPKSKPKNSSSSTTLLDFTNILRSTGNSSTSTTHDTDALLSLGSGTIQKQKSSLDDINSTALSETIGGAVQSPKKKGRGISAAKKKKLSKDTTTSGFEKSPSPSRKLSTLMSPSKNSNKSSKKKLSTDSTTSAFEKSPSPSRKLSTLLSPSKNLNKSKSPLKLPVFFNMKSKTKKITTTSQKLAAKATAISSPTTLITSAHKKSPRPKPKQKTKATRRKRIASPVVPEPDPEMPVLEKMVYYTEPVKPHSPIKLPKAEPTSTTEIPATQMEDAERVVPVPENLDAVPELPIGKQKEKLKGRGKRKDEETQTASETVSMKVSEMPTQIISSNEDKDNQPQPGSSHSRTTEVKLPVPVVSKNLSIITTVSESLDTTVTLDSDEDEEDNLFSFEHLSKCSSPNVMPKINHPVAVASSSSSSDTLPEITPPDQVAAAAPAPPKTMMPPPVMRPPRTPKKTHPVPVPPQTHNAIVPLNPNSSSTLSGHSHTVTVTHPNPGASSSSEKTKLSAMSTYQLLSNQTTLLASFGLLNQLASKEINAEEVGVRLGLQEARRKRAVSPDICLGPSRQKHRPELMESRLRPRKAVSRSGTEKGRTNSGNVEQNVPDRQGGEALVGELLSRWNKEITQLNSTHRYEPQGDEFDMSQSSFCMVNVYPHYEQKSRTYKMHSKNISELTISALKENFNVISSQILDIFAQKIQCERHQLFLEGHKQRNNLRDLNVSVPFNQDHGMTLMNLLADLLVPNPLHRPMWTDYINFVMLPESFIRIYAHVNQIPYKRADAEMRFGACYDDDSIHQ